MSIEEASTLVLISSKISKNRNFCAEMGKPINILNLAKKLITTLNQYEKK